jgi:hypothetical protein
MTAFDQFCFVCGNRATHALRVSTHVRVIGCCAAHVQLVKDLQPQGRDPVNIVVISRDGERSTEEMAKEKSPLVLKVRG